MLLNVLGRYGPYPRAGGACSGYLLSDGTTRVLLDCGAGVLTRLLEYTNPWELDAIIVSHLHYDHCSDLFVLRYALDKQPLSGPDGARRTVPLYLPPEPQAVREALCKGALFQPLTLEHGAPFAVGSLSITPFSTAHPVPTFGLRIRDGAGRTLCFTGDTGLYDGLAQDVRGADALLADVCFVGDDPPSPAPHLSARQAGRLAKEAGVGALYCTHLSGAFDTEALIKKEVDFASTFVVKEHGQYRI